MIKFLRISSIYPGFLKNINNQINKNDTYELILRKVFEKKYSVSNNISKELVKKNYECIELIHNIKILQEKWLKQYGNLNNTEDIIFQQIKYYNPDILFIGDINLLSKKFIDKVKSISQVKLTICFHCAPFSKKNLENLKLVDAIITCTEGYRKYITKEIKKDVFLMQHAFEDIFKINFSEKRDIDVSFLGSIFLNNKLHVGRIDIIYSLLKHFKKNYIAINFSKFFLLDFSIFILNSIIKFNFFKNIKKIYKIIYIFLFSKKPIFGKEMIEVLKNTKILINKHIEDSEYAGNMRLFEGTGLGCLLITDYKRDIEKLFNVEDEIVLYNDHDQLVEKIKFFLKNHKNLEKIAKKGYFKTKTFHNYSNRINKLDKFFKERINCENL